MPRNLKLYITGLVATSALALGATSLVFPGLSAWPLGVDPAIGIPLTLIPGLDPAALGLDPVEDPTNQSAAYRRSFAHYTESRLLVSVMFYGTHAMLFFGAFLCATGWN